MVNVICYKKIKDWVISSRASLVTEEEGSTTKYYQVIGSTEHPIKDEDIVCALYESISRIYYILYSSL